MVPSPETMTPWPDGITLHLPDEAATLRLAGLLMPRLSVGSLIHLKGELGAGKTCFVRGCLSHLGHAGRVKSPTFTLVEEYVLPGLTVFHFDLYRLSDPEELEWMGIRDYLRGEAICFVEWPEHGAGILPAADLEVELAHAGTARRIRLTGRSPAGRDAVGGLLSAVMPDAGPDGRVTRERDRARIDAGR